MKPPFKTVPHPGAERKPEYRETDINQAANKHDGFAEIRARNVDYYRHLAEQKKPLFEENR